MRKMNMLIVDVLRNDKELKQFRQEWKGKFTQPFPPWNYDCYGGIDDYKQKIKEALKTGDHTKANGTIEPKFHNIIHK